MPIYELKCKKCGNVFEFLCFHSSDEATATCPSCGGSKTEKLLSTFSSASSGSSKGFGSGLASASCSPSGGFS
ncbi:MAG: zinc ribbon domain-containing protein [Deltaproteobacteria bacterium]|nr:zinc ribbon domain-containing protein [Deltaproteobacteria bacterium]MBW2116952.1 zinc ribbon domain-containing protein [Deltaproteobacteria bacterium]MBW2342667.1 zinc ribbon domain-containing protein [Deltaproteobacteria bacterium]